jgi:hypothetical protein
MWQCMIVCPTAAMPHLVGFNRPSLRDNLCQHAHGPADLRFATLIGQQASQDILAD